jgi:hypothetical protein
VAAADATSSAATAAATAATAAATAAAAVAAAAAAADSSRLGKEQAPAPANLLKFPPPVADRKLALQEKLLMRNI